MNIRKNRVPVACPEGFQGRYTVVQGDTMFLIAKRFGIALDLIFRTHPLKKSLVNFGKN